MPSPISLQLKPSPRAISLYYFGIFAVLGVYLPLFPSWLEGRGARGLAMGAIAATLPAMGLVAPPVFGLIADALGVRVWLIRAACAGALAVFALLALSSALGVSLGFGGLFAAALAFAFFRAPMFTMADVVALEASLTSGIAYGRLRLWGSISFALMAIASGALIDPARPAAFPVAITAALLVAFALSWALPAGAEAPLQRLGQRGAARGVEGAARAPAAGGSVRERARALLQSRDFRLFLAASFLAQSANSSYDLCYTLHLRDVGFPEPLVGVAWAVGVAGEIALMAFSGPLLQRFAPPVALAVAFAGASLRWALLSYVRFWPALLALQPLHAVSFAMMWVASLAYTRDRAPPQILATAQGLFSASAGAGSVIGMLAWGELYKRGGGALTFGVASITAAIAFVLAVTFARSTRRSLSGSSIFSVGSRCQE
ncbi:MFS transporter [Sorangium cellulosum]|uniref:MFS transporter n=1 Tax=Sorangium cellulosum TaxID=56 RepID=A0A4P2R2A4_SORCE|nr:MFS transporter [Sorangium cellulosum]WCQ95999.1 putative 3-phenylpropionic acid transporter [Sorangium sp. Soce836]